MQRRFTSRQRRALQVVSGNCCSICGVALKQEFHADHVKPFCKGGKSVLNNGQALCPDCNLKKGSKLNINLQDNNSPLRLRRWQTNAKSQCINWYNSGKTPEHRIFLANAAPGAGKTIFASVVALEMLKNKMVDRVVVIAPREEVVSQWAKEYTSITNRSMTKVTGTDCDIDGYGLDLCVTWNSVETLKDSFQKVCKTQPTFLICDEHHHAARDAAWGKGADNAFREAKNILILTGTPVRSDGSETVWLHY